METTQVEPWICSEQCSEKYPELEYGVSKNIVEK